MAAVKIRHPNIILNIVGIYRPPTNDNVMNFDLALDTLQNVLLDSTQTKTVICGDFNIDALSDNDRAKSFNELIEASNFKLMFREPTRVTQTTKTCIDNILINFSEKISDHMTIENYDPHISDHNVQILKFQYANEKNQKKVQIETRKINDSTIELLNVELSKETWETVFQSGDTDIAYNEFISIFEYHFNRLRPKISKEVKKFNEKPKFVSKETYEYKNTLDTINLAIKNNIGDTSALNEIRKEVRKKYRKQVNKDAKQSNSQRINNSNNVTKETWKIINELKKTDKGYKNINVTLNINDQKIDDPKSVANAFNDHYLNVPIEICNSLDKEQFDLDSIGSFHKSIFLKPTSDQEVEKIVRSLKSSSSAGNDEVSNIIIKNCIGNILAPLVHICNIAMRTGKFPSKTKDCIVKTIHKSGATDKPGNYRPLTITSSFSKVFEKILLDRIEPFLRTNNLINEYQFGYKKGKSTIDAVTYAVDIISKAKSDKEVTIAIFLDLSKAFDCVRHDLLFEILYRNGLRGNAYEIMKSFLIDRKQCVEVQHFDIDSKVKRVKSDWKTVL
ncbi:uncharacterized protein LOC117642360 [Thrips palmi]|uniref:Uncharacterized protein LOC117642360 n=1 Tax=Thrips palmi TaxID=161013 RepID=A0A6P8YI89_THRPL|nr:uncharacterized protein LOC117642360 [Thrips palmi]